LHVLYRSSSRDHQKAYDEVGECYGDRIGTWVEQGDRTTFRPQLLALLAAVEAEKVFFLVDDIVFTEAFDLGELSSFDGRLFIPSLRLGANLRKSYTVQREQPLPLFFSPVRTAAREPVDASPVSTANQDDLLCWAWEEGPLDWGYPLSVDGHLFSTSEIRVLADCAAFSAPNSFENALQVYAPFFTPRLGVCYRKSRMVNIPWNRVQNEVENLYGNLHQDELLAQWARGFRIDFESLSGVQNESAHQEFPLGLVAR
jgi:hypothetical protein